MGSWSRRNAFVRIPPIWRLVVDRDGVVVDALRRQRVGRVIDIPDWGCLIEVYRGIRLDQKQ